MKYQKLNDLVRLEQAHIESGARMMRPTSRAEELIADLEAEIVKRDARIAGQALDIERITKAYTSELDELAQRNYNMRFELAKLEQQRGGVVLPERDVPAFHAEESPNWHGCIGWNAAIDEVARLNPPGECVAVDLALHDEAECCAFVLENIGSLEPVDIDGDDIDLRFEDAEGRDTGSDVSIVEYAERGAKVIRAILTQQGKAVGDE